MNITNQYQYLQEFKNIQIISEKLKLFRENLEKIYEYDILFQNNKHNDPRYHQYVKLRKC